jgi:hypothetical protein
MFEDILKRVVPDVDDVRALTSLQGVQKVKSPSN